MEPPQAGQPAPDNILTATFLRQIITEPPYRDALSSIIIAGAMVTGQLDLNKRSVPMRVVFEQSHFLEGINLESAQLAALWACRQCYSPASFTFRTVVTPGTIDVTGTQLEGALDLGAAIIDGDVLATGAAFAAVVGRGARLRGSLNFDGAKTPEIVLGGIIIDGDARLSLEGPGTRVVHAAGARVGGQLTLAPRTPWPTDVRIDLTGASIGMLTPPNPWPANTEARDVQVTRVSPAVAAWILDRLNRSPRTDVEGYTQLAGAAAAAGDAAFARQIQRVLRDRQHADASGGERFWMTVEDLGWISYAIALALAGAIAWVGLLLYRRRAAE
jgi:hypothetical protein